MTAKINGFEDGQNQTTVTVTTPPTAGPMAGNTDAAEAIVARVVPTLFMRVLRHGAVTVRARASGMKGSNICMYALNKTSTDAFTVTGNNTTNASCGAVWESSSATAFRMSGNSNLRLTNNAQVGVMGDWQFDGQARVTDGAGMTQTPQHIPDPGDPLAWLPRPTTANIQNQGLVDIGSSSLPPGNRVHPGVYCGGMRIGSTGGVTVTMMPGTYVMAGGGFRATSTANVDGTAGVTIFNTSSPGYGCLLNYAYASVIIDGSATVRMNAPVNGTFAGILFYQDRSIVSTAENTMVGGADSLFNGALYFPTTTLSFAGNNTIGGYVILVADKLRITGTSTINNDYTALETGSPLRDGALLVESGSFE
jgi:hypothetical protein